MYAWLWRHLPGGTALRVLQCAGLLVVVLAVLWFAVFPWLDAHLPYAGVTVSR